MAEIISVKIEVPEGSNVIIGQAHFIKTAEDLYEIIKSSAPEARFGIALSEASGPCLVRTEGNDELLIKHAAETALAMGAGHAFVILLRNAYPVNILNAVKSCQEVCGIFCATANPLEVIIARTGQGRGIIGVVDGFSPKGVEGPGDVESRRKLLRQIGYKL